jgi:hypothetical protein
MKVLSQPTWEGLSEEWSSFFLCNDLEYAAVHRQMADLVPEFLLSISKSTLVLTMKKIQPGITE